MEILIVLAVLCILCLLIKVTWVVTKFVFASLWRLGAILLVLIAVVQIFCK